MKSGLNAGKNILVIISLMALTLSGCQSGTNDIKNSTEEASITEEASSTVEASVKRKIIIDTDTAADDASALILAARAENVEILGVTVLVGNVDIEQGTQNALMALEQAGSDAPVYLGMAVNADGENQDSVSVYGVDGMGDADLIHPEGEAEEGDAVKFILEMADKYPGELEIVALGPATNIANAIERAPETMKKVKMVWSMGTSGLGPGNASPVAEFNVFNDAKSYKTMLDFCDNITVVGLDMCDGEAKWTSEQFELLEKTNETGRFIKESFRKLRELDAANGSADASMNCDAMCMACAIFPDFVTETVKCHGSCITEPGETFGQVIFYKEGFNYDGVENNYNYNVTLVTAVEKGKFFDKFLALIK